MLNAVYGILVRDVQRAVRQKGRLVGGIVRPFMWLLLVGGGYGAIARVEGAPSHQAFMFPGVIVMATFFGAMLTAISTVYDREFGMLRLMLAAPAGVAAVLAGRTLAAALVGLVQGLVVLAAMPLFVAVTVDRWLLAAAALIAGALASGVLGLVVAAPLRSIENFAGIINVVLFPLLFLSGALYPTAQMPPVLRALALANPLTYAVDLERHALGQSVEFGSAWSIGVLALTTVVGFVLATVLFDAERRLVPRAGRGGPRPVSRPAA